MYIETQQYLNKNDDVSDSIGVMTDGSIGFNGQEVNDEREWLDFLESDVPVISLKMMNGGYRYRYGLSIAHRDLLRSREIEAVGEGIIRVVEDYKDSCLTIFYGILGEEIRKGILLYYKLEIKKTFKECRSGVALSEFGDYIGEIHCIHGRKINVNPNVVPYHFAPGEIMEGGYIIFMKGYESKDELTLHKLKEMIGGMDTNE